ncbi:F-box only protein 17 isoform X2 [Heterocephalus glaber]|uniref:F-box only protein 17 isoform X2 n=1 Tax=Heterocephalus glaber TaxID=10181 RepID=A0AAX6REY8_HETGA|nr:F-box only protein 17 isoform X2 [Heterocephalus glaber]
MSGIPYRRPEPAARPTRALWALRPELLRLLASQPLPKTLRPGPRRGPGLASGTWGRYVFSIATPLNAAAMGARPSRRGRPVDPPMALDELPLELLVRVLSYVPPCTLVTRCRAVCRTWREVVDGPTVWLLQLARDRSAEGRALYALAQRCPPNSEDEEELPLCALARFSLRAPLRRNLIFNSCGEQGFRGWEVEHGGNGWAVEKNITLVPGAPSQTCFVTSFEWCFKRQLVDLVTEGLWQELLDSAQLEICVADWWGARENCGCIYRLRVRLLDVYENEVVKFSASPNPVLQWTERTCRQNEASRGSH